MLASTNVPRAAPQRSPINTRQEAAINQPVCRGTNRAGGSLENYCDPLVFRADDELDEQEALRQRG